MKLTPVKFKYKLLTPVKYRLSNDINTYLYGYIISKIEKVTRDNGKQASPYYLVTGYGPAIWEDHLEEVSELEFEKNGGKKWAV